MAGTCKGSTFLIFGSCAAIVIWFLLAAVFVMYEKDQLLIRVMFLHIIHTCMAQET